jgi:hypothetical protein
VDSIRLRRIGLYFSHGWKIANVAVMRRLLTTRAAGVSCGTTAESSTAQGSPGSSASVRGAMSKAMHFCTRALRP